MILLVSGATVVMRELQGHPNLGRLCVPRSRDWQSLPVGGWTWACDNGAFSGFDESAFLRMLLHLQTVGGCRFVACPDVVGDHDATLVQFRVWAPRLAEWGWRPAFVAQNGCTIDNAPWEDMRALFIGGDTEYKLRGSVPLIEEAKRRGLWVHVGRVNTLRRLDWAIARGADSVDGSAFSRFSRRYIAWALDHITRAEARARAQQTLPGNLKGEPTQ